MVLALPSTELILDRDEIFEELAQHCPDSLTLDGTVSSLTQGAEVQSTDAGSMSATFTIVTRMKTPNRNGNINQIAPSDKGKGLLTENYQRNPIVLFDHGMSGGLPIGKSETPDGKFTLKLNKQKAVATVYFSQMLAFAAEVYGLVDEKILRMASIGFMPTKAQRLQYKSEQMPEGVTDISPGGPNSFFGGFDFVESDLMEWSVVGIGADPGALRQCQSRGMIGQEKIRTQKMRQWIEQRAEPKPAMGIGFDASSLSDDDSGELQTPAAPVAAVPELVTVEFQGMTFSGSSEMIAATIQKLTPSPVIQQVEEKPAESVDRNANLSANAPQPVIQSPDPMSILIQNLPTILGAKVQEVLAPCLQASEQTLQQLQLLTGGSLSPSK